MCCSRRYGAQDQDSEIGPNRIQTQTFLNEPLKYGRSVLRQCSQRSASFISDNIAENQPDMCDCDVIGLVALRQTKNLGL